MHILVIEDNETLGKALRHYFTDAGHAVTYVDDGELGLQFLLQESFDCCILDLNLPTLPGMEILSRARKASIQTPILVLTARDELADRVLGLDTGADDYLTKPFEMEELEARIRALMRRRPEQTPALSALGRLTIHHDDRLVMDGQENLRLSQKEFTALEALSNSRNQLVPKSRLINQIYGVGAEINDTTIEVLISRLRKKLSPHGITIKIARGIGYFLQEIE